MIDTYTTYESSIEQGRPIQFYRFTLGSTIWTYTSADQDLVVSGQTWLSTPITDDGIKQTGEAQSEQMSITAPDDVGPAVVYATSPPSADIKVEILRMHEGMTTLRICFVGTVVQVGYPHPGQCLISVQTMSATMRRTGLRICYQRACPYALYDTQTCRADKTAHALPGFIRSINGYVINVDEAIESTDNVFAGGFLEWQHPVRGTQRIMIESSLGTGGALTIFDDVQELNVGMPITVYPGCDKTPTTCQTVFNNYVNYGGFEFMPGKSPYDGNPIF